METHGLIPELILLIGCCGRLADRQTHLSVLKALKQEIISDLILKYEQ